MWFPMILSLVTRHPRRPSILPQTRRSRRGPARRQRPFIRPYLDYLEDRTVSSSVTVLASHLHTADGRPEFLLAVEAGARAQTGNGLTFDAPPGTYHLDTSQGQGTYGSFTVASDGTISGTTGALVASGSTIDFDLTKLAPVTISALLTLNGRVESMNVIDVANLLPATDTVYLPGGTFYLTEYTGDGVYVPVHAIMFIRPLHHRRRAPRTRPTPQRWFRTGPRLPGSRV